MTVQRADEDHLWRVASRIFAGKVVPFLGAGANLCGRPDGETFRPGQYLPSGAELAQILVRRSRYPVPDDRDLMRVSQYVDAVLGEAALYEYLRMTFDADYPPTALHRFLADVPGMLREYRRPPMLILTTNYDDALERALAEREEPYELLWYEAKTNGSACGHFVHDTEGGPVVIERPNEYRGLGARDKTVILKLHGAIDRSDPKRDSYVITEDNYVDYLTRTDIAKEIPVTLRDQMEDSHFLFLGYSLRDWNLRVILRRIWSRRLDLKSWAIQREEPDSRLTEIEQRLWSSRGDIDLLCVPLDEYVVALREALDAQLKLEAELTG